VIALVLFQPLRKVNHFKSCFYALMQVSTLTPDT